ncbi:hypothetical protein JTB14_032302 [Gonioctena quinquepunctata]|nr:hypothetical protein JTB14_032302 [Gonioctena quinquepunctata]
MVAQTMPLTVPTISNHMTNPSWYRSSSTHGQPLMLPMNKPILLMLPMNKSNTLMLRVNKLNFLLSVNNPMLPTEFMVVSYKLTRPIAIPIWSPEPMVPAAIWNRVIESNVDGYKIGISLWWIISLWITFFGMVGLLF